MVQTARSVGVEFIDASCGIDLHDLPLGLNSNDSSSALDTPKNKDEAR
jgi:hypothetical protein